MDGGGPREDGVAEGGAAEVADAELHPGDAAVARGHVRAHARQRLRHQRRHAAVQHLERLAAGGGHEEAPGEPRRGELLHLEPEGVQRRVQLRHHLGPGFLRRNRGCWLPRRRRGAAVHGATGRRWLGSDLGSEASASKLEGVDFVFGARA